MTVGHLGPDFGGGGVKQVNEAVSRMHTVSRGYVYRGDSSGKGSRHPCSLKVPDSPVALCRSLLTAGLQLGETGRMVFNCVAAAGKTQGLACNGFASVVDIRL